MAGAIYQIARRRAPWYGAPAVARRANFRRVASEQDAAWQRDEYADPHRVGQRRRGLRVLHQDAAQ